MPDTRREQRKRREQIKLDGRRRGLRLLRNEIEMLQKAISDAVALPGDKEDLEILEQALEVLGRHIPTPQKWQHIGREGSREWARAQGDREWAHRDLVAAFDCNSATAWRHLRWLLEDGLVEPVDPTLPRNSNRWRYRWIGGE